MNVIDRKQATFAAMLETSRRVAALSNVLRAVEKSGNAEAAELVATHLSAAKVDERDAFIRMSR